MTPIEQKMDELQRTVTQFRDLGNQAQEETKKYGEQLSETKAALEKANEAINKLNDEIKSLHAAMNRGNRETGDANQSQESKARREAFQKLLRKGAERLTETEHKALSVQSDPDGGYLVLPEMSAEIVKKVFESSPIRQLASVQQISSDSLEIIEDLDEVGAGWATETGSRSETSTAEINKLVIAVHEMYAKPKASQKILDDASINMESWLADKVAEKFARTEATAFVSGDGINKPRGILSYAAGTAFNQVEQVNTGAAAAITADGVINLAYSLKSAYKQGAVWLMKRATLASVRLLKDAQDQYLWQPGIAAGQPDMLLGYPVFEADDVPAEGAGNLCMVFGNIQAAYQIVDRFGIRTLRDPYSSKPYIEFYTTKRVGGGVKNFEAVKIAKCST